MSETTTAIETTPAPSQLTKAPGPVEAMYELRTVLHQAGIYVRTTVAGDACTVGSHDAVALAQLVRDAMQETYQARDDLATCLRAHGLDMSEPVVIEGMVDLGDVSIPVGAQLAVLLGAPPEKAVAECDEVDAVLLWAHGERISELLCEALRDSTGAKLVDHTFHPDCMRCSEEAAITVGRIDVQAAQQMVKALQFGP
ncbi:hypothetical protein [Streptomyces niger]|uniref:hypothetical protein n=1 Tax=Streptomyces niger TaxID=66373 RepID=UPI0018FE390B|nr:hypothetical protein [Streptomyces niger]